MLAADLVQLVHSSIERNSGIPAILDAYSEFVDSPIGPLELQDLESVFSAILANLSERFPQIASKKAATNARNDIVSFLSAANNNPDRVKSVLATELRSVNKTMAASIAERFSRMSVEERRAIDATLRLIRRSQEEIMFRVEAGKGIEGSGAEFQRFFAAIKAESPTMRELRYQNLIVEKGVFNKLLLKSKELGNYTIWVPSFFAKENVDFLVEKAAAGSEHLLLSRLREMKEQGSLDPLRPLLRDFLENQGVLSEPIEAPGELRDFVTKVGDEFVTFTPIELDDISAFFLEEEESARKIQEEKEKERSEAEELERQKQPQRVKKVAIQVPISEKSRIGEEEKRKPKTSESIYIGKSLDIDQFVEALNRRVPEREIATQVKILGDYYVDLSEIRQTGISIVGSSGSGRSTTLRRILDGLASASASSGSGGRSGSNNEGTQRIFVIDQKGEHRGIAWKYKWGVLAFAKDTQSQQFRLPQFLLNVGGKSEEEEEDGSEVAAALLQEWLLQAGVNCTEQQRARIASVIRSLGGSATPESVSEALLKEPELVPLAQKLAKNILSKNAMSRLFSEQSAPSPSSINIDAGTEGCVLFDISGRGMRDPTTREERLLASVLILKYLLDSDVRSSVIVLEDVLDRFKSESLRKKVVHYVSRLREKGNTIVSTARSQIREFVGVDSLEILHRLSGEKVLSEEIDGFKMSRRIRGLENIVPFLPRGYAFTSSIVIKEEGGATTAESSTSVPSAAVRIEPLQFSTTVT